MPGKLQARSSEIKNAPRSLASRRVARKIDFSVREWQPQPLPQEPPSARSSAVGMRPSSIVLATVFLTECCSSCISSCASRKPEATGFFEQRVAVFFKRGDFRRLERLAAVLFFLERLAFAHQAFIRAARGGVGQKGVNALPDAAVWICSRMASQSSFVLVSTLVDINIWPQNKPHPPAKANANRIFPAAACQNTCRDSVK